MKRKAAAVLLALCLFISLAPSQSADAASDVCFIAINDTLLELSSSAYYQGSTLYVPYSVFVNFRIYNSYYSAGSTASLYTASKQIYFELTSGNTYDGEGNYYSSSAISRNGSVYVSVAFVCSQFGLSWSYIYGTDSGDICRIKDGGAILSDSQFLSAASSLMSDRYNVYKGNATAPGTADPSSGNGEKTGCALYLSFQGMPSSTLLDALKARGITSCFFVTAGEVRNDPDTVRRIVGEGHGIGVLCSYDPAGEYENTSALIFEAARVKTILIASASADYDALCQSAAEKNDLVFWRYDIDGVRGGAGFSYASLVTTYLGYSTDRADVRIKCCAATDGCIASVLTYMISHDFNFHDVCEVGNTPV